MNILIIGGEGYIGSRLKQFLEANDQHIVDSWDRGFYSAYSSPSLDMKYIPSSVLHIYDCVINLAAHPSVPTCEHDPRGSWKNNVENFASLLHKMRDDVPFIYASSGSVYGSSRSSNEKDMLPAPMNQYDMQKQVIDLLALKSGKRVYGLRFGTVCGVSPNPRLELVINSMYCDAVDTGQVRLANPLAKRATLGLNDLCRAIGMIISRWGNPGVYNLASMNATMTYYAHAVAKEVGAEVITLPATPTYDFTLNTSKFEDTYCFQFQDTVRSIIEELRTMPPSMRNKSLFNRSTRVFKYE